MLLQHVILRIDENKGAAKIVEEIEILWTISW